MCSGEGGPQDEDQGVPSVVDGAYSTHMHDCPMQLLSELMRVQGEQMRLFHLQSQLVNKLMLACHHNTHGGAGGVAPPSEDFLLKLAAEYAKQNASQAAIHADTFLRFGGRK